MQPIINLSFRDIEARYNQKDAKPFYARRAIWVYQQAFCMHPPRTQKTYLGTLLIGEHFNFTEFSVKQEKEKRFILEQIHISFEPQQIPEEHKFFNDWEIWHIEAYKEHLLTVLK